MVVPLCCYNALGLRSCVPEDQAVVLFSRHVRCYSARPHRSSGHLQVSVRCAADGLIHQEYHRHTYVLAIALAGCTSQFIGCFSFAILPLSYKYINLFECLSTRMHASAPPLFNPLPSLPVLRSCSRWNFLQSFYALFPSTLGASFSRWARL